MTALTHPWPVWGTLLIDGSPANNVEVKVEDVTQVFDKTVYTNSDGEYVVTLTNEGTVHDGDTVRVTVVGWQSIYREDTATEGGDGSHLDFARYTKTNTDTVNLAETPTKKPLKILQDTVSSSDSHIRKAGRVFSHTLQCSEQRSVQVAISKEEGLQFADSLVKLIVFHRVFSESVDLSDSLFRGSSRVFSESLQGNDSLSRVVSWHLAHQESVGFAEDLVRSCARKFSSTLQLADSRKVNASRCFSDSLQLGDSLSRLLVLHKILQDTVNASDSFARVWLVYKVLSDTLQLSDAFARDVSWFKAFQEALELADIVSRHLAYFHTEQESVQLLDQLSHVWHAKKQPTETLSMADSRVWASCKTISSALQLADSRRLAFYTAKQEQVNFADSIEKLISRLVQEALELSDSVVHGDWAAHKTLSDSLQVQELTRKIVLLYHLTNNLTVYDLSPGIVHTIGSVTFARTFETILNLSDGLIRKPLKVLSDSLQLEDLVSHGDWTIYRTVQDIVQLDDSISRFAKHLRRSLAAESLVIYDNPPSGLPGRSKTTGVRRRTLTETLQLTHPQPVFSLGIVRSDTLQLSDTWNRVWTLYRSYTENLSLADLMSSDLYGPFKGVMDLARLGTALELQKLVSDLDLKRLQSALELRQGSE